MHRILILTLCLMASVQAGAAFYSTAYLKQLIDSCNSLPDTFDASPENFARVKDCGLSTGYILGIYDELDVVADRTKCIPGTLSTAQAITVVENWIQNHPERLQDSADKSVESALNDAWSCPKQN